MYTLKYKVLVPYNDKGSSLTHDMAVAVFHILCYVKPKD